MQRNLNQAKKPGRGPIARIGWFFIKLFIILCLIITGFAFLYRSVPPPLSALMVWRMASVDKTDYQWQPLNKISRNLVYAVIASEDGRFCEHHGVDWLAVEDVLEKMKGRAGAKPRGASTISMQVARNLFLWPSRSYVRKALEIPVAYMIDALWTKRRMMEIYLNIVELGPGIYGAEAAAQYHFNRSAARLNRAQAALLAASLPNPLARNPAKPSRKLRRIGKAIEKRIGATKAYSACISANYAG